MKIGNKELIFDQSFFTVSEGDQSIYVYVKPIEIIGGPGIIISKQSDNKFFVAIPKVEVESDEINSAIASAIRFTFGHFAKEVQEKLINHLRSIQSLDKKKEILYNMFSKESIQSYQGMDQEDLINFFMLTV